MKKWMLRGDEKSSWQIAIKVGPPAKTGAVRCKPFKATWAASPPDAHSHSSDLRKRRMLIIGKSTEKTSITTHLRARRYRCQHRLGVVEVSVLAYREAIWRGSSGCLSRTNSASQNASICSDPIRVLIKFNCLQPVLYRKQNVVFDRNNLFDTRILTKIEHKAKKVPLFR
jgi:hypothetical protein